MTLSFAKPLTKVLEFNFISQIPHDRYCLLKVRPFDFKYFSGSVSPGIDFNCHLFITPLQMSDTPTIQSAESGGGNYVMLIQFIKVPSCC